MIHRWRASIRGLREIPQVDRESHAFVTHAPSVNLSADGIAHRIHCALPEATGQSIGRVSGAAQSRGDAPSCTPSLRCQRGRTVERRAPPALADGLFEPGLRPARARVLGFARRAHCALRETTGQSIGRVSGAPQSRGDAPFGPGLRPPRSLRPPKRPANRSVECRAPSIARRRALRAWASPAALIRTPPAGRGSDRCMRS